MKYISLLLLIITISFGCGKKTDPIPKSAMAEISTPVAIFLSVTDNGVLIENGENENILIEKGVMKDDSCAFYDPLGKAGVKGSFEDTDVEVGKKYSYRIRKKSVKYGLASAPAIFNITYAKPLKIEEVTYEPSEEGYLIKIVPSGDFMRFDAYSGGKLIASTGKKGIVITKSEVAENSVTLRLTDGYGNKGEAKALTLKEIKPVVIPEKVKNIHTAWLGEALRIVWDEADKAEEYEVKICENVSCETVRSKLPFIIYKRDIVKCADIFVASVNGDTKSQAVRTRYCKQEY